MMDSTANRHSMETMTTSVEMSVMPLLRMLGSVPVTALWAPTTSLLNRDRISPPLVWVKKRSDMRARCAYICWRRSKIIPSPIRALARWQVDDGHVSSPNDAWGLNTFATAQALQAIAADSGAWPYVVDAGIEAPAVNADRRLVNALYLDLLGRPADAAGAAFWEGELAAGRTPAEVARALTGTREYAIRVAHDGAERYLGGELTAAELDEAVTDVRAGRRTALYGRMLAEGDAPADEWAADLFRLALGREGSDADVAWIVDSVDGGARTRAQAATAVLDSSEGRGRWVSETYRDRLRRHAGAAERAFWVGQLGRGRNPSHLVAQIAGSAEYRSLTLPTVR